MSSENTETPVLTSNNQENINSIPCSLCRRQFSKYTCPKCNVPYCSLICFRSQAHAECSESFYRKEIESDIKATPSKTTEERQKMMELLKRFEEDTSEEGVDDNEEDEFSRRFEDMDLGKYLNLYQASYDDLWSALTPAERNKFMSALRDPSNELAQQLLASEHLETERVEPWWDKPSDSLENEDSEQEKGGTSTGKQARRFGSLPEAMTIPQSLVTSQQGGNPLIYNIVALLIAYSYTTRSLSISPLCSLKPQDPELAEAQTTISRLTPFLTDSKSTVVFPTLNACITDVWSRFEPETLTPALLSVLLQDTSKLLRPSPVSILPETEYNSEDSSSSNARSPYASHANFNLILALSDLSALFQSPSIPTVVKSKGKENRITHKLAFYAAKVVGTPSLVLGVVSEEVMMRMKSIEREELKTQGERTHGRTDSTQKLTLSASSNPPLIEELPSS